jgi:hypothetical protein
MVVACAVLFPGLIALVLLANRRMEPRRQPW